MKENGDRKYLVKYYTPTQNRFGNLYDPDAQPRHI